MKSHERLPKAQCAACSASGLLFLGPRGDFRYYHCVRCGTIQLIPMPDPKWLVQAYKNEYADSGHCQADPEQRNREAAPQFQAIADALLAYGKPELVLDYGPGWGGLLDELRRRGMRVIGAELSDAMATYCERKGHTIIRAPLEEAPGKERYDAIVLSSVFEHLTDHETWLGHASRLLRPSGLLVSLQPTAHFALFAAQLLRLGVRTLPLPQLHQVFWAPWHTALFSREGMRLLCERNGFSLLEARPAPLQRGAGCTGLLQKLLSAVNRAATPFFGPYWPLHVGHVFIFRRSPGVQEGSSPEE